MFPVLTPVDIMVEDSARQFYREASKSGHPWPDYATPGSGAVDLVACTEYMLRPGECAPISTGIRIHMREPGYVAVVLPRSGLGVKQGIVLGNNVGLIDNDYQGPVTCYMWNRSIVEHLSAASLRTPALATKVFHIKPGMRIAQMMFLPLVVAEFSVVGQFVNATERGERGFGSTGA